MTFARKQLKEAEPTSLEQGDFRSNGSWNPAIPGSSRGPRYRFVKGLVRARRAAHLSPAQVAEQIEASPYAEMFPELAQWQGLKAWDDWPRAWTRNAAEECVKRCGYASSETSYWDGGAMIPGEDERHLPEVPIEQVRAFVNGLTAAVGAGKDANKRVSDQEFFEGKSK